MLIIGTMGVNNKYMQESIMNGVKKRGKQCKAPTHLIIEISELIHPACVTKNGKMQDM